jgi:hypothetical protein
VAQQTEKKESQKATEQTASNVDKEWSADEIKLLVKGVKIIAVGTKDRYFSKKSHTTITINYDDDN